MIIPANWPLPDSVRIRLGQNSYGRQRAIVEGEHLLLVLHKPPGPDDAKREGLLYWRNPAGEWQFSRGGPGPGALKRHLQAYAELETRLASEYEMADSTTALFDLLEQLTPLVRAARNQHLALQAAREAFKFDPFLIEMRDLAYDIERNLDLLLEDVRNALNYRTARDGEEQAQLSREALRASHRLNVLAALTLPLTALTSVFGMNLPHGLGTPVPGLFWSIFLGGLVLGFLMKGWVLARPREETDKAAPPKAS